MRYYIKHYTTKTVIDWMSLGHVGLLWSNNFFHVSLLNYSLIHLASLTNHLINLKSLNCEHVFFMFSSKLSTNQLFCGQYFSHLVFVHKNMFLPVKYSAQPHSHHDVPLSLVLCVFLLAQLSPAAHVWLQCIFSVWAPQTHFPAAACHHPEM